MLKKGYEGIIISASMLVAALLLIALAKLVAP
jgi:hypothetical protein